MNAYENVVVEIMIQDEYNNLFLVGFFRNLEKAKEAVKKSFPFEEAGNMVYFLPEDFDHQFDSYGFSSGVIDIVDKEGMPTGAMIRGFVFNGSLFDSFVCDDDPEFEEE